MFRKITLFSTTIVAALCCSVNTQCEGKDKMEETLSFDQLTPLNSEEIQRLVQQALEARQHSYSPYSNFKVGAALLASNGVVYQGTNIENASYGMSCCAERVAVFKAVSEGIREFDAIAVVVPGGGSLCGACRQVLNEFNPNLFIVISDENGWIVKETRLSKLLVDGFGPRNLMK